jgi:hypothetical protein
MSVELVLTSLAGPRISNPDQRLTEARNALFIIFSD